MAAEVEAEEQGCKRDREDGEADNAAKEEPPNKEAKVGDAPAEAAATQGASCEVYAGRDAVNWLTDDSGRRLRKLGAIADAEVRASEDGSRLAVHLQEGAPGGIAWVEFCIRAMCALRAGQVIDARPPSASGGWAPPLSMVEVPREEARGSVSGKAGERLLKHSEELGVIAVFGKEASNGPVLKVGGLVEAKYEGRDRWFEAKVVEVGKSSVKVKWTYDDNVPESSVPIEEVRACAQDAAKAEPSKLEVGALVDAKFGGKDRWFEAVILRVDDKTVKVKWTYDEDVPPSEVDRANVKTRPKLATDRLYIAGPARGRMELELRVLAIIESKVPGFVSSRPPASDEGPDVGMSVLPLLNDGEFKGKVIGKGGSVRQKIVKTCRSFLDYIGNYAFVVGTQQERVYTAKLLELVQKSSNGAVEGVPTELEAICSRMTVPQEATFMVTGKQRATMNQTEEDTGTLMFWAPASAAAPAKAKGGVDLAIGKVVEGCFKDRWFEATILEISKGDDGADKVKVRWHYDESEMSVLPAADIREVSNGKAVEPAPRGDVEDPRTLVIFGLERPRKSAELKVMATIEQKCPGTYKAFEPPAATDSLGHEVLRLDPQEAQRCAEKRRRAAATAANCLMEQVGEAVHLAGTSAERARAREYIQWLAMASPTVPEAASREDVDEFTVPANKRANLVELAMAPIELDTQTLAFFEGGVASNSDARLFVCGHDNTKRAMALLKLQQQQDKAPPRPAPVADDDGEDFWGRPKRTPKVVYVVSKEEEERRRKRAERFATPPSEKR